MRRLQFLFVIAALALPATACDVPTEAVAKGRPLWLAIGYDISGSAAKLPTLTLEQVDRIVAIADKHGDAVVAFDTIGATDGQLVRLELQPVAGPLDERARKTALNRQHAELWRQAVADVLGKPRNESLTSFNCSAARLRLFFEESIAPADAQKVAMIISDAIDTAHVCKPVAFPADVNVLTIGMDQLRANRLATKRALRFESNDAAVTALGKVE